MKIAIISVILITVVVVLYFVFRKPSTAATTAPKTLSDIIAGNY